MGKEKNLQKVIFLLAMRYTHEYTLIMINKAQRHLITAWLPRELVETLDREAFKQERSRSFLIKKILTKSVVRTVESKTSPPEN